MAIKEDPQPYIDPFTSEIALEVMDPRLSPLEWSPDTRRNVTGTLEVFSRGVKNGLFPRIRTEIGKPDHINQDPDAVDSTAVTIDLKQAKGKPYQDFILSVYTILSVHINTKQGL